jgi:hypothetical protein
VHEVCLSRRINTRLSNFSIFVASLPGNETFVNNRKMLGQEHAGFGGIPVAQGLQSTRHVGPPPTPITYTHFLWPVFAPQPVFSGNSPGIHREASAAGNARRKGARVLSEVSTPRLNKAETKRLLLRSLASKIVGDSTREISPR